MFKFFERCFRFESYCFSSLARYTRYCKNISRAYFIYLFGFYSVVNEKLLYLLFLFCKIKINLLSSFQSSREQSSSRNFFCAFRFDNNSRNNKSNFSLGVAVNQTLSKFRISISVPYFWNSIFLCFQRVWQMFYYHIKKNFIKRGIFPNPIILFLFIHLLVKFENIFESYILFLHERYRKSPILPRRAESDTSIFNINSPFLLKFLISNFFN